MSLYQLTYEPGTPLWKSAKKAGFDVGTTTDAIAEMYENSVELIHRRTKLRHYEVSNYAQPGHESVHNLAYWRGWDYIGVGPGAHGRFLDQDGKDRVRTTTYAGLERYISQCEEVGSGVQVLERLEAETVMKELVVLGLRIKEGIDFEKAMEFSFGRDIKSLIDWNEVERFCEMGLLEFDLTRNVLRPTELGLAVVDSILAQVIR
ncbi:UNVERIFIED_CONTAM: hypothetical protein HDU68_010178 [Siphonaria sp. JEL0065]|nr:hypothetical protein HDU68_010178 [Siphonaria sp. JEL0065]